MKIRAIPDPSYFRNVCLILGSDAEIARWLKAKDPDGEEWDGGGRWMLFREKGRKVHYLLISTSGGKGPSRTALLAHEVLHLTFAVLGSAGLKYSDDSEEAFTYYFQAMFQQCLRHL